MTENQIHTNHVDTGKEETVIEELSVNLNMNLFKCVGMNSTVPTGPIVNSLIKRHSHVNIRIIVKIQLANINIF